MARAPRLRPFHYTLAAAFADVGRGLEPRVRDEAALKIDPTFRARDPMSMQLHQCAADRERIANAL